MRKKNDKLFRACSAEEKTPVTRAMMTRPQSKVLKYTNNRIVSILFRPPSNTG